MYKNKSITNSLDISYLKSSADCSNQQSAISFSKCPLMRICEGASGCTRIFFRDVVKYVILNNPDCMKARVKNG